MPTTSNFQLLVSIFSWDVIIRICRLHGVREIVEKKEIKRERMLTSRLLVATWKAVTPALKHEKLKYTGQFQNFFFVSKSVYLYKNLIDSNWETQTQKHA